MTMTIKSLHIVTVILLVLACHKNAFPFCFERAGKIYGISPKLIKAIAWQESAFDPAAIHHNHNGSFDYGVMQINSWWYETLGSERWQALSEPCFNVMVGTWILQDCIDRHGYTWDCLSCYRTGKRLTALSEPVRKDVIRYINRIEYYFEKF
jgi:soluble lytic murein transglycosylase-like protein